jgi:hypothetical protein
MKSLKTTLMRTVILVAMVLIASCATRPYVPTEDETLYGIWVNEEYNEDNTTNAMYIYYGDGRGKSYKKTTDPEPRSECRFTIEEKWTDKEGNTYYRILAKWANPPYEELYATPWYLLVKIHVSGDVMETVASRDKYHEEITQSNLYWYMIHHRQ